MKPFLSARETMRVRVASEEQQPANASAFEAESMRARQWRKESSHRPTSESLKQRCFLKVPTSSCTPPQMYPRSRDCGETTSPRDRPHPASISSGHIRTSEQISPPWTISRVTRLGCCPLVVVMSNTFTSNLLTIFISSSCPRPSSAIMSMLDFLRPKQAL